MERSDDSQCAKCDIPIDINQKSIDCATCRLKFHTSCAKVSDAKYEILMEEDAGILWFCKACIRTTSNMLHHLANMKIRLDEVETQRLKDQEEIKSLSQKLVDVETALKNIQSKKEEDLDSFKEMVGDMLDDFPQNALNRCQSTFDITAQQVEDNCDAIHALENRISSVEAVQVDGYLMQADSNLPDRAIAAIANEIEERKKRKRSIVLHNVPENHDSSSDIKAVVQILQEVSGKEVEFDQMCNKPRIYRLGQYGASGRNKPRSIKVHLRSTEECAEILENTRKLSQSVQHSYVVIQPDLTLMQRNQIRTLVMEKRRRNRQAITNNEEPDWTISSGFLHRRRHYH